MGKASWYGGLFQGKATASGEDYNMFNFTAAHRELPLGTFVKVTNLKNLKAVIVRINDRGPVTPGRIIDLSYSAARYLEMRQNGLQKVRIDIFDLRMRRWRWRDSHAHALETTSFLSNHPTVLVPWDFAFAAFSIFIREFSYSVAMQNGRDKLIVALDVAERRKGSRTGAGTWRNRQLL